MMEILALHDWHAARNARFTEVNGMEVVTDYGDAGAEYDALRTTAGVLDLSFRGRLCLTGADRARFLNGQVTNNVKDLRPGQGCYAALVTAKGKMESDLNIFCLPNELLLDLEPGYAAKVTARLEKYVIADDVQIVDAGAPYGLLSVQGPKAEAILRLLPLLIPEKPFSFTTFNDPALGEIYLVNHPRLGTTGIDLFVPTSALASVMENLVKSVKLVGGCLCGWTALEIARIEAGIPRFGIDMDETNLAPEGGIESRAISYSKGCYIGQEVIARIRTYGQVAKSLRSLRLADDLKTPPARGDKLLRDGKDAGYVTSAVRSPRTGKITALGYVRREANQPGTKLVLRSADGESEADVADLAAGGD